MFQQLEDDLSEITGFHKVSLQPNAGSQVRAISNPKQFILILKQY